MKFITCVTLIYVVLRCIFWGSFQVRIVGCALFYCSRVTGSSTAQPPTPTPSPLRALTSSTTSAAAGCPPPWQTSWTFSSAGARPSASMKTSHSSTSATRCEPVPSGANRCNPVADPGGGGVTLPRGFFYCLSVWKFLRSCLFRDPDPPPPSRIPGSATRTGANWLHFNNCVITVRQNRK